MGGEIAGARQASFVDQQVSTRKSQHMSLMVTLIAKDQNFNTRPLEEQITEPHNTLFGFETWRQEVWGHDVIRTIGCPLVYSLRETNVFAYDEQIAALRGELQTILDHIDQVATTTGMTVESIEFRVKNALETARVAEQNKNDVGVALW